MHPKCLFGHKWHGCICSKCKATRDLDHDWNSDFARCTRCGSSRWSKETFVADIKRQLLQEHEEMEFISAVEKDDLQRILKLLKDNPFRVFSRDWVDDSFSGRYALSQVLHLARSTAAMELLLRSSYSCMLARCLDPAQARREYHAFVNKESIGRTALHCAAHGGKDPGIAKLLLANGADVNALGKGAVAGDGLTPLHSTVDFETSANAPAAKVLLANGANVNAKDKDGRTPLHLAVRGGDKQHLEVAEILLINGADPNAKDCDGRAPLHNAAVMDRVGAAFVTLLIANGADVNAIDNWGGTPLHVAASRNQFAWNTVGFGDEGPGPVIVLLLASGADANATDNKGETPLEIASKAKRYEGITEVVQLLRVSTTSQKG